MEAERVSQLKAIEKQILWLSCWMIHHANNIREKGEVKVGGHQASSASMVSIMTALYFHALRARDRVAVSRTPRPCSMPSSI
jgi:pyruvate dehydrogenase E1 component